MTNNKIIKKQAKESLSVGNNWVVAVAGTLVLGVVATFVYFAFASTEIVPSLIANDIIADIVDYICYLFGGMAFLFTTPFLLGYWRLCYQISKNKEVKFADMFYYFTDKHKYKRALALSYKYICKFILVMFAVMVAPVALVLYLHNVFLILSEMVCLILIGLAIIVSVLIATISMSKYVHTIFIFFENENLYEYTNMYFKASKTIYKSQKNSVVKLALSFLFWVLLLPFVLPLMYIMPYFVVSICNFSKWSIYNALITTEC